MLIIRRRRPSKSLIGVLEQIRDKLPDDQWPIANSSPAESEVSIAVLDQLPSTDVEV